ncbi:MAG: hypothetical protein IT580_09515, partial [Verrucomicrobiales bacterium]|nr:hypothetical protein [Verrucomicrobiales bacterium]
MFRRPAIPGLVSALALILTLAVALSRTAWSQTPPFDLFARSNLVAWCIVPFDAKKRGPEERAEMLTRLGLRRFAYDWRAEHIPSFDAEIAALQKRNIELTAWWFPATLNAEALTILDCLRRHRISPQLWITLGTEPEPDPRKLGEKMAQTLTNLEKLCAAAREVGSTVGLYNHLGWFGEPPNQVALIQRLHAAGHTNVGIVYNFHHGHAHIDRFPELMWLMRPYLLAVNLNGMIRNGEQSGKKITPLGTGTEELDMLRALQRSGWRGPVGILGHTEDDAEWKLGQELEGLSALVPRLNEPGRALARRLASAPDAAATDSTRPAVASLPPPGPVIVRGRFGPALDARVNQLVTAGSAELRSPPLLVEAWVRLEDATSFNIIAASESKASPTHWELYSYTDAGDLAFFSTAMEPQEVRSGVPICDGRWHHVAVWIDTAEIVLYVDGQEARRTAVQRRARALPRAAQFAIGRLVEGGLGCRGFIESVRLGTTARSGPDFGRGALAADAASLGIWTFETENDIDGWSSLAATVPAQGASHPLAPAAPVAAPDSRAAASPPSSVPTATATAIVPTTATTAAKPTPSAPPGTVESAPKAAPRATGTGVNRDEPWLQTEDNWVDDRWNRTTQGRWQMYTFPSPTGSLRKGLAVRLGSPATASVAYDTETGQWRHAWLGGFLTFDAARFGLLNPPKPAGDSLLALPASARWTGDAFRWRGFAVSGDHLVLEYSVGTLAVRESPGSLPAIDATLLLRDFEFGPHAGFTAELPLLQGDRAQFAEGTVGDTPYAGYSEGSRFRAIALSGDPGVEISTSSRTSLVLRVQPRTTRARARIFYFFGERARVDRLEPALQLERAPANLAERIVSAHGEKTAPLPAQGQLGSANEAYAIDTIPVPYDNPWKALLFCSGVGFFTNGDAAVSTIHGDVWRVSGLDASLAKVEWQRIATGLFQPLGLTVVSNQV